MTTFLIILTILVSAYYIDKRLQQIQELLYDYFHETGDFDPLIKLEIEQDKMDKINN